MLISTAEGGKVGGEDEDAVVLEREGTSLSSEMRVEDVDVDVSRSCGWWICLEGVLGISICSEEGRRGVLTIGRGRWSLLLWLSLTLRF